MIQLYNTLTHKIEDFAPIDPDNVRLYSCGPTVYDFQHIGHMRRYVGDDILIRTLRENGYQVKHVMNITDVGHLTSDSDTGDDKMEKGAKKYGMSVWDIAKKFEEQFFSSIKKLNIEKPDLVMHATDYINDQIDLVEILAEKGYAYEIGDGIYFDTSRFPNYLRLSGQKPEDLKAGARVNTVKRKKNITDFALWKFSPKGEKRQMEWWFEGPLRGKLTNQKDLVNPEYSKYKKAVGFPGWHIECSAMSMLALGPTFDIHTGGVDHIAVHHTNEIAQSEAASGQKFVNYWVHHAFLLAEGQKMSKSLGNIYTVDDIVSRGFSPLALRYLFLQTHYRHEMNFTWKALAAAQGALDKLYEAAANFTEPKIGCAEFENKFYEAVTNDLDTPGALSVTWELIRSSYPASAKAESLYKMDKILGLGIKENTLILNSIPQSLRKLLQDREKLRKEKKFGRADQLKHKIEKLGYIIKDTKDGTKVIRKI